MRHQMDWRVWSIETLPNKCSTDPLKFDFVTRRDVRATAGGPEALAAAAKKPRRPAPLHLRDEGDARQGDFQRHGELPQALRWPPKPELQYRRRSRSTRTQLQHHGDALPDEPEEHVGLQRSRTRRRCPPGCRRRRESHRRAVTESSRRCRARVMPSAYMGVEVPESATTAAVYITAARSRRRRRRACTLQSARRRGR